MGLIESLIKESGAPFADDELAVLEIQLDDLGNEEREQFRNANASSIAENDSNKMLIVAGPGSGKSHLFMSRIHSWISSHPKSWIHVASFVRKLIIDLQNDLERLDDAERQRVQVSTLHRLARSIVERNHGTVDTTFGPHIAMIGGRPWQQMVWGDTLAMADEDEALPFREFEHQFHDNDLSDEPPWPGVRAAYLQLCVFYNAIGFADSIIHATQAVGENPELVDRDLWIFDEFQDFNRSEEAFIDVCTTNATSVLLAGDDDQALYQRLKFSHPEIIRGYYKDSEYSNAMLPYCSRCGFHITKVASAFLARHQESGSIRKVLLPLVVDEDKDRVQVVACAHPASVATYIERFAGEHRDAIEKRRRLIEEGTAKDPYLLILSFANDLGYLGHERAQRIHDVVDAYKSASLSPGPDYDRVRLYLRHAQVPTDNFTLRKVLFLEGVPDGQVHDVLRGAMGNHRTLAEEGREQFEAARQKCAAVASVVLNQDSTPQDKADSLVELLPIEDRDRLAEDLENHPLDESGNQDDEPQLVSAVSAVELLTMTGSKGLSADHVIIIGCDQLNMAPATPQVFFVAMTRARKSLHLITSLRAGGASQPHNYLDDLPEENCRFGKYTQQDGFFELNGRAGYRDYFERVAYAQRQGRPR